MSSDRYDRIAASTPINKTAATVTGKSGIHYEPAKKITQTHWDAPQPVFPIPSGTPYLTGMKCGRLTVIGYRAARGNNPKGALWLVRCACGQYEERRTKSLINTANVDDCCAICRHTKFLRREAHFMQFGRDDD